MKASASPRIPQIVTLAMVCALSCLSAKDTIVQKDGTVREVQILGLDDGTLKFKVGPVQTGLPMTTVASVTMDPPAAYNDALAAWRKPDAARTLALLKPLVDNYRGLPTPWAERASALLGEVYLSLDQVPAAETAYAAFQKAYPSSTSMSDIGLARLAVAKKDFDAAKVKLQPIIAEAEKTKMAQTGQSATFGQAYYLMGMVRESEGAYSEALQDYLSAVTLFYEDKAIAAKAQERADFLITEKQAIVP